MKIKITEKGFSLIELIIVLTASSWPIRSSKTCGLYFYARTFEFLDIFSNFL